MADKSTNSEPTITGKAAPAVEAPARKIYPIVKYGDPVLEKPAAAIKKFDAERVPSYWSQISSELHKLEQANGISEQSIRYAAEESGLPNLQRVKIETGVAGEYGKIAHFINALERDKLVFLINQVSVAGLPTGTVTLQIKFETFLKVAG